MARKQKTYKKNHRKRRYSRRRHMKGGSILGDLANNFVSLKNNFTNGVTSKVSTNFSMIKDRAMQRFNKASEAITKKISCIKMS
jgi:hypothetical protein